VVPYLKAPVPVQGKLTLNTYNKVSWGKAVTKPKQGGKDKLVIAIDPRFSVNGGCV
jgi:hypothetical protein